MVTIVPKTQYSAMKYDGFTTVSKWLKKNRLSKLQQVLPYFARKELRGFAISENGQVIYDEGELDALYASKFKKCPENA